MFLKVTSSLLQKKKKAQNKTKNKISEIDCANSKTQSPALFKSIQFLGAINTQFYMEGI